MRIFSEDVGPFAGLKKYDEPSFQLLYDIFPKERVAVIFSANPLSIPSYWKRMLILGTSISPNLQRGLSFQTVSEFNSTRPFLSPLILSKILEVSN